MRGATCTPCIVKAHTMELGQITVACGSRSYMRPQVCLKAVTIACVRMPML